MIEQDTIRLLRECDAGIKMGISSIEDVLPHVKNLDLSHTLSHCKDEHEHLGSEIQKLLDRYGDEGKNPNPIAKGMSWMKTNMKLGMEETDATILCICLQLKNFRVELIFDPGQKNTGPEVSAHPIPIYLLIMRHCIFDSLPWNVGQDLIIG